MPEVWVHGDVFVPGNYGPEHLLLVDSNSWTDQQGQKLGHAARFVMRDERLNFFHATIPVRGRERLQEVRVEFSSIAPVLRELWVHQGRTRVVGPVRTSAYRLLQAALPLVAWLA